MSHLTDAGKLMLADFVRGIPLELPPDFEIACLTAAGDDDYIEASWDGYDRVTVARTLTAWCGTQGAGTTLPSTGTSHQTSNNDEIDFGTVGLAIPQVITHLGLIIPESSDGTLIAVAELAVPMSISEGDPVSFAAGSVVWTLGITGGLSDYFANKLIDLIWRGQAYSMPGSMWATLLTSAPTNAGGGSEVAGGGYARVEIEGHEWTNTDGELANDVEIVFPSPSGDWGTVTHHTFRDAATLGNMLFWAAIDTPRTVTAGGTAPRFGLGQRRIRFE